MKALSVRQPWASMIAQGTKTIETRTWSTGYRGDLLIVSSKKPEKPGLPAGMALCVVRLTDCRPMTTHDEPAARCQCYQGAFAWCIENVRPVEQIGVRGRLGIYEVDDDLIWAECRKCKQLEDGCDLDRACICYL